MKQKNKHHGYYALVLLSAVMVVLIILGRFSAVPSPFIVVLETIDVICLGAAALWCYANGRANGSEWWQDDEASGWRGDW